MSTIIHYRRQPELDTVGLWEQFANWVTSTQNRIYIGWFGVLMIPTGSGGPDRVCDRPLCRPPVDMEGIREPIFGSIER
jgi:photosystem II P680 reaction center D1 protein